MSMLSRVQRGRISLPPRLLVYGTEGIGKSSFGAQSPKPVFIQTEDGLNEIDCAKFPLATTLDDVLAALTELQVERHDFETVVIDSADWLERLIWDAVCREYHVKSIEKADGGYARGYSHAVVYWRQIIDALTSLRSSRGMLVLLIAHSKIERFEDPETSAYDRYSPRLHKNAASLLCEWVDAVLFATRRIRTQSEDAGFNRKRTIANGIGKGGGDRILRCVGGPSCVAKNRFGITDDLPLSWADFMSALTNNVTSEELSNG